MKKILVILFMIFTITGCRLSVNINNGDVDIDETIVYYEDDRMINWFITQFNSLYPNDEITSDMLSVYHHHGTKHKNQVQLYKRGKQITLTGNDLSNSVSVFIDNLSSDNDDTIRELVIQFTKVFDNNLTDEQIEEYWHKQKESNSSINEFNGIKYQSSKNYANNTINYIKISGKW